MCELFCVNLRRDRGWIILLIAFLSASCPNGSDAIHSPTMHHTAETRRLDLHALRKAYVHGLRVQQRDAAALGGLLRLNGGFGKENGKGDQGRKKQAQTVKQIEVTPKQSEQSMLQRMMRTSVVGFLSGAYAGLWVDLLLWPIETIKTRLQTGEHHGISLILTHPIQTIMELFEGCWVALMFAPIFWGLFFAAYEPVRNELLHYFGQEYATSCYALSAACGLFLCFTVRCPIEVIKTRMMTGVDKDFSSALARILQTEGFLGLYRGFWTLGLREFPFSMIEMSMYENVRTWFSYMTVRDPAAPLRAWETAAIGSICDSISACVTNPFDVLKSRLMKHDGHGLGKIVQEVVEERGVVGFLDGARVRSLWMGIGGAIYWPVFEWALGFFGRIIV